MQDAVVNEAAALNTALVDPCKKRGWQSSKASTVSRLGVASYWGLPNHGQHGAKARGARCAHRTVD